MPIKLEKTSLARRMVSKSRFTMYLEREIDKGEFPWEFKYEAKTSDDAWHPSGDCTPSLHDLYLKATDQIEHRPISIGLRKTFMVGHFWHQYLQELTLRLGFADNNGIERVGIRGWDGNAVIRNIFGSHTQYRPYHYVRGAADVAPCRLPTFGDYLVDFKTMGSHDFRQLALPRWAAAKYECQINIYMDLFDMDKALIVAINKDSPHDLKEFEFVRNDELIAAIYNKWHIVSACLDEGIEPPVDEDIELPIKGMV